MRHQLFSAQARNVGEPGGLYSLRGADGLLYWTLCGRGLLSMWKRHRVRSEEGASLLFVQHRDTCSRDAVDHLSAGWSRCHVVHLGLTILIMERRWKRRPHLHRAHLHRER